MRICDLIKDEPGTIKWLRDEFEAGNLYVDNSFQRRYVWLNKHQVSLVETILMGYVVPEIYIWETGTDPDTGVKKYSIVDGQQRIGAIVDFINGKYKLKRQYVTDKNAVYVDKFFSELPPECKSAIWGYTLSLRRIHSEVNRDDIVSLFLRLNSTDKSLNPQELRNAEFEGCFLKTAIELADLPFWKKNNIFNPDSMRRMKDIEFISSLLIFLRKGIDSEITQTAINQIYDLYNEEYDEAEGDKQVFNQILDNIEMVINADSHNKITPYISKTTHFYTIFVSIYKYVAIGQNLTENQIKNLIGFYQKYEESNAEKAVEYKNLLQSGTSSKPNRMSRQRILAQVIDGKINV